MPRIYLPGQVADRDLMLNVIDERGHIVNEINVKAGQRVPPTKDRNAVSYQAKN